MLELGDKSEEEHMRVIEALKSMKPGKILLVGSTFQKISAETDFKSFHDVEKLREHFKAEPLKGNLILIKGSRGMTLEKIYDLL